MYENTQRIVQRNYYLIELYLFPNNEGFKLCGFILSQSAEYSLFTMQTEC
jgi:hypothetical protein